MGHVFRETNQCADFLAKMGCSMTENFVVFYFPPSADLNVLIEADKNGLYYYRCVANTFASVGRL